MPITDHQFFTVSRNKFRFHNAIKQPRGGLCEWIHISGKFVHETRVFIGSLILTQLKTVSNSFTLVDLIVVLTEQMSQTKKLNYIGC